MISCTKSKDNIDMFYFKGKRITAKKALQLQQKKGLIISECDSVYNRSSKPVREVMKKVDECETRYTVTKQLYDELYNKLNDATEQIEVMNRICMSREFKEQLDENFRRETDQLNEEIRSHQSKIKDLNNEKNVLLKRVDENINNINDLTDLLQRSKDELQIIKEMNEEEKRVKTDIKNKLDDLTSLCSDRPALQQSVKMLMSSLNEQRALFQDKEATLQGQIIDYEDEIKRTLGQLKTSEEKFVKTVESLEENQKLLQNLRTDIDKLQRENGSLMNENNELQKDILSGKEVTKMLEELKVDMEKRLVKESELINELKQEKNIIVQKDLELNAKGENELVLTLQVNDIQKQLNSTNKILKDLENECSDRPQLLLKVDKLQTFIENSTNLLKKRDNELISIKSILASTEDKYEKEVKNLKTQKRQTEGELANVYDQSTKLMEKCNNDKVDFQTKLIKLQNKVNELKNCCDDNKKLLTNVEDLKGEIEAIKVAVKSDGPLRSTMEMRIRKLRKKYKY
jgi:chromosome segregation ATPase